MVAIVAHDRSAGELIAITPGRPPAADRVRPPARARPAGCTACGSGRRPSPDGYPVHGWVTIPPGPGPAPGAADRPRRPVRAVRLVAVRRDAGLRLGRVRGRAVQPARLVRLRRGARAGDPGRRSASWTPPTSSPSSTPPWTDPALDADRVGVMGGSYGGYLTTLLIGRTTRFAAGDQRAGVHRPGQLRRVLRHRLVLPRPVPRHRPGARSRRRARWPARPASRRRRWSSTPRRTGAARSSRAPGSTSSSSAAACPSELLLFPGEGHELSRSGRPRHRLARLEHVLRWWARWLPTARNPGDVEVPAVPAPRRPSSTRRRPPSR